MTKVDISKEIQFKTARSGGKGGQNVNKVETMVEGNFKVEDSVFLTAEQKELIRRRLVNKMNSEGFLQVKSQASRSQLENKGNVIKKMNAFIELALHKEKKRIPTKPGRISKEKRLDSKKKTIRA